MSADSKNIPLLVKLNNYGQQGNKTPVRGVDIAERIRNYDDFTELLPSHNAPAICEPSNSDRSPLTHQRLKKFVREEFDLLQYGIPCGQRVALLLPNGPELALAVIATISRWCAAPINPTNTWQEIKLELQSTKSMAIMVLAGATVNEAALQAAKELNLGVITITPLGSVSGVFRTALLQPVNRSFPLVKTVPENTSAGYCAYNHPEIVLLLHTSGTSGNKKLVPYSMDMIIVGVACIVTSWNLQSSDVCLNMMPLFHIGGIVRNILSPLLSGGAVICCSGFDPLLFWDVLYSGRDNTDIEPAKRIPQVTWYYAAPTMHHAILTESERRPHPLPIQTIRYIANAAGGLLPVLANRLRDTFEAVILTSYGMTECMPISTPPQSYRLDPTGTSGTAVGPDILIVGEDLQALPVGSKGNICVRGPPCFGGYENNGTANEESFISVPGQGDGWFNTGDMGHVDAKGYLFISGRSKEIINRGGETISPFEIEEAIQQHPNVKETIAFSAPHEQYQETVGIILVSKPNKPRLDLPSLHKYIESKLHRSKWPYIIIYSDGLPKNAAGKTLRIKFAERIGLKNVDEESSPLTRLLEASCPPVGTALTVPIPTNPVAVNYVETHTFFLQYSNSYGIASIHTVLVDLPANQDTLIAFVTINREQVASTKPIDNLLEELLNFAKEKLHAYLIPQYMYEVTSFPTVPGPSKTSAAVVDDEAMKQMALEKYNVQNIVAPRNAIEKQIELIWRSQLGCASTLSVTSSFFELGGDSLKAGQIVGIMRDALRVPLSVADLFTAPTIEKIAVKVSKAKVMGSPQISKSNKSHHESSYNHTPTASTSVFLRNETRKQMAASYQKKLLSIEEEKQEKLHQEYMTWEFTPLLSNTSFGCLFIQALPIILIYPMRRIIIWFLIAAPWVTMMDFGFGRFVSLVFAMFFARLLLGIFAPLCGIAAKWIIIGRYQPGKYPLWGAMYLKWWIVEQIINIMGKGFFRDDLPIIGPYLVRWYYVLMGAKIGNNVKIHKDAKIGQADLLTFDDDVAIDNCTIRPFSIEEGHFVLLPIHIKKGSSVGVKSVISAGSTIPANTSLGPLSSSHEIDDADPSYRHYCRPTHQPPPNSYIIFFGIPILLLVLLVSMIPWYIVLHSMVAQAKEQGWYASHLQTIYQVFLWWITPQRLKYFLFLRVVKRCLVPFLRVAMIILIKWTVIGKFTEMNEEEKAQPWNRFRCWLMAKLMPGGGLSGVAKLVGTHYECISIIYRLLGAKIGKHVYWPGSGLEIVEYDLLEIGDDVVFGSRSVVITSTTKASKKVVFEAGSMVADRCVILPGVILKKGAVLGSGALAGEDMIVPVGSVWLGSQDGCALNVAPADTSYAVKDTVSPFAKGFYLRQASFFVIPLWAVMLYNTAWQAFCTCYRNCPTVLSLMICSYIKQFDPFDSRSPWELFKMTYVAFAPLYVTMCVLALSIDITGKWWILGERKAGEYPWDQSSYCQRWQLYLTLQEIRRGERHKTGILDMIQGSQYLVWYFRLLGAKIGNNVCLYPNGGDPMMTEPDLVTIGDFAGIDDASLIAHINTRGVFRLNPLSVGTGCILKSMSRLLSGGSMEPHSILYEHTLVLSGETVGAGSIWQGWPSRAQFTLQEHRANVKYLLNEISMRNRWEMRSYATTTTNSTTTTATTTGEDQRLLPATATTAAAAEENIEEGHTRMIPLTPGRRRSPAVGLIVQPERTPRRGGLHSSISSHIAGELAMPRKSPVGDSEYDSLLPSAR